MNDYRVLTSCSVLDLWKRHLSETEEETALNTLFNDQCNTLKEHGYEYNDSDAWSIHYFESPFHYDRVENMTVKEAIECLAIKDGYDIVQFSNGNVGFVAYYNGRANGFEILGEMVEEYDDLDSIDYKEMYPELFGLSPDFFYV